MATRRLAGPFHALSIMIVLLLATDTRGESVEPAALPDDIGVWRIGTGELGSTTYTMGLLIAQALSGQPHVGDCPEVSCGVPGLVVVPQLAPGSVDNLSRLAEGHLEAAIVTEDIAHWAAAGAGPFRQDAPQHHLRALTRLFPKHIHLVTRADTDIRTVRDLVDRKTSLDEHGSETLVHARLVLKASGLSEDSIDARYIKPRHAMSMLAEGAIDALFMTAAAPVHDLQRLARDTPIKLIPLDGPDGHTIIGQSPHYRQAVIPSGSYPGIPDTATVAVDAILVTHRNQPVERIRSIITAYHSERAHRIFAHGGTSGRALMAQPAWRGGAIPPHDGIRRLVPSTD